MLNGEVAIKYGVPRNTISTWVKKQGKYFKVLEAIPYVREVEATLEQKFYITFLFSVRKEEKECKI